CSSFDDIKSLSQQFDSSSSLTSLDVSQTAIKSLQWKSDKLERVRVVGCQQLTLLQLDNCPHLIHLNTLNCPQLSVDSFNEKLKAINQFYPKPQLILGGKEGNGKGQ